MNELGPGPGSDHSGVTFFRRGDGSGNPVGSLKSRRRFLAALGLALLPLPAAATPESMAQALAEAFGGRTPTPGRVKLELPPIAENGLSVSLRVSVESPMSPADHVESIHVFSEKNPLPVIASFHFSPRSGRARVETRIRLADTQKVLAVARMNDGSLWSAAAQVLVTNAACGEEG